mmetsp:Transcript_25456/g.79733  ORF Transcript_25456/g.79733 Transcript_25456/m.79733 type:complete len:173 (-) Transcript_25456:90-608(-)
MSAMAEAAADEALAEGLEALSVEDAQEAAAAFKAEGNEFFKAKDYQNAVDKYGEAVKLLKAAGAPDAVILCNRAAAYIMLERYVPALRDAQQAAELNPDSWKAHWRTGVALMRMVPKKFRSRAAVAAFERCGECPDLPEGKRSEVAAELARARARLDQQEAETPMPEQCAPS